MNVNRLTTAVTIQRRRFDQLRGLSRSSGPVHVTKKGFAFSLHLGTLWFESPISRGLEIGLSLVRLILEALRTIDKGF